MSDLDDVEERRLRIEQMTINIDKMHADMRWETRKFVVSLLLGTAAAVGAGAALGTYIARQPQQPLPTPPPQTIIIQQQPYMPPAAPPAP